MDRATSNNLAHCPKRATFFRQIHILRLLQPEYSVDKQWVFVGETNHEAFTQPVWGQYLLYGGNADAVYLLNDYSTNCWIPLYLGHNIQAVGELTTQAVAQLPEVQEMPAWPNYGAVKVVGDYVVVKFS